MDGSAQLAWIASAVDALDGINASEVRDISAELRRSVTRPAQIVPEIARLVSDRRKRRVDVSEPRNAIAAADMRISAEARDRYGAARNQAEVEEAWRWERQARKDAGLPIQPLPPPLTRDELDTLPADIASLGLDRGFFEWRAGKLCETNRWTGGA